MVGVREPVGRVGLVGPGVRGLGVQVGPVVVLHVGSVLVGRRGRLDRLGSRGRRVAGRSVVRPGAIPKPRGEPRSRLGPSVGGLRRRLRA